MPILPVVISDYSTFYSVANKRFNKGLVTLTVLPEIPTEGMTVNDVPALCDETQRLMRDFIESQRRLTVKSSCINKSE